MTLGKHGPSFFSAIGALFVHLVFFFLAGYIIQNRLRTPQKPSYNLKMLNKKLSLPAKKQPIRESEPMIKPEIAPSIKPQAVQALSSRQKIKQAVSTVARQVTAAPRKIIAIEQKTSRRIVYLSQNSVQKKSFKSMKPRAMNAQPSLQVQGKKSSVFRAGVNRELDTILQPRSVRSSSSLGKKRAGSRTGLISSGVASIAKGISILPPSTPSKGIGNSLEDFQREVQIKIESKKRYPPVAKRRGYEGRVILKFTILKNGQIKGLQIVSGSRYENINQAALMAVEGAAPFFNFPDEIEKGFLDMTIPFNFKISENF